MAMLVRGPIPRGAPTAIDPRDGSEVLVMDIDVHKRLPANLDEMTDALLKGTLEELLERAVDLGLTTADGARATRRNVAAGKFTNRHYIDLWTERLAELDRQGLLPPIGRKLEGWEIQARRWANDDILTPEQLTQRRAQYMAHALKGRAKENRRNLQRPKSKLKSTSESELTRLSAKYSAPQPGLAQLQAYRTGRRALSSIVAMPPELEPELELEPEPEPEPEYVLESQRRVEEMHVKLEGAAQGVLDVRQHLSSVREELSAAAKMAFERIDVDGSGELDKYELKGLCTELGIGINVRQLKSAWKWMDKDGDGRIELEEFDWWLFGDKSGDGIGGDGVSARIDVALFDQFVKGLGIAETMKRAQSMYGDVMEAERTLKTTKSETDAFIEKEAAWVEEQRKNAELEARGRERDEKKRKAREAEAAAAAALGAEGARAASAANKVAGLLGSSFSKQQTAVNAAAQRTHDNQELTCKCSAPGGVLPGDCQALRDEYALRLVEISDKERVYRAPPQPLKLVRRAASGPIDTTKTSHPAKKDEGFVRRPFRPSTGSGELLKSKDWHRHRRVAGRYPEWRRVDSTLIDIDATTGIKYKDVSFEMLKPEMEIEVFWQEDNTFHRAIVQDVLCATELPSVDPSEWKNKLLFYPDVRTSGMEYEALEKPGGNVGVVVGRMKYVEPPSYSPLTAEWDGNGRRLTKNEESDGSIGAFADTPAVELDDEVTGAKAGQTEMEQLEDVLTAVQATGKLSAEQVRAMRQNVVVGKFPASYYLVRLRPWKMKFTGQETSWTVPTTGWYEIEAIGAGGGNGFAQHGGRGARIKARFMLNEGDVIYILIGGTSYKARNNTGGGGGTFLALNSKKVPLLVAGGGGGTRGDRRDPRGGDASLEPKGNPGIGTFIGAGGVDGKGGDNAPQTCGNGGGGLFAGGDTKRYVHGPGPGRSFADGGQCVYQTYIEGTCDLIGSGFGGGGGHGLQGGGGGGGYSGGGGGDGGGGGGSYVRLVAEDVRKGHAKAPGQNGKVTIEWALLQNGDTAHAEAGGQAIQFKVARFGPQGFDLTLPAVRCDPETAKDELTNPEQLKGNIAVVKRGGCAFVLKALRCEAAGAAAVVVEFKPGDELQNMGDPDNKAKGLSIPVVAVGPDDASVLLAAPALTIRHGEPPKEDKWADFAGMASKKGHDALMDKLLQQDNAGSYRVGKTGSALALLGGEGNGRVLGATDFDPTTGNRFSFAMKKAGDFALQEVALRTGSGEKEYNPNPKALMDFVVDTFGFKAAHGYIARTTDHHRAVRDQGKLSRTYHGRTLGAGVEEGGVVLRLEKLKITDAQCVQLAEYLPLDPALTEVYLGNNSIGEAGGMALASVVRHCPSLKVFSIAGGSPGNPLLKMEDAKKMIRAEITAPPYTLPNNFGSQIEPRRANREKKSREELTGQRIKMPGVEAGRGKVDIHKFRTHKASVIAGSFRQTEALGAMGQKKGGRKTGGARGLREQHSGGPRGGTVWGSY